MKILFISRRHHPSIGGVEKHVREVSERLVDRGNEVTILTEQYKKSLKIRQKKGKIKIFRIEYPHIKYIGLLKIWYEMLKLYTLFKKSDIIHVHDVMIWLLPIRILFPHKKIYVTLHGWEGVYPVPQKNIYLKRISNNIANKSIAVGKYIEEHYGVKANIITYGAVGIPEKKLRKKDQILYVGRLAPDTGLQLLLDALKIMPGAKVTFVGDGPLRKYCRQFGKVIKPRDASLLMAKSKILYASGYLTILEGFANKCIVYSGFENKLRQDYLTKTPFRKWIYIHNDPVKLALSMKAHLEEEDGEYTKKAYEWVKMQTWNKLVAQYKKLWSN